MATASQCFPLGYQEVEVVGKERPNHRRPRFQPSWEQSATMLQPEINAATPFIRNSSAVLAEIDGIEDEVKPTEYAYTRARSFVESAYSQIRMQENVPEIVPEASVTTDDVGGIRLAWRFGLKQVRANFGANANLRSYLYFESALEHHVEDLDLQRLDGGLDWLTKK